MMDPSTPGPSGSFPSPPAQLQPLIAHFNRLSRQYHMLLDRSAPHVFHRWIGTAALVSLFLLRVLLSQGWYIVCYAHAIYLLNLLLAFLQPKFDPSLEADLAADNIEEGGDPELRDQEPVDDEFRPFIRRLPEWDFWLSATRATIFAILATVSEAFDVPVYWPILLMYFCTLFAITMRRQIRHMIKYKYVPFDFGRKQRYGAGKR